MCGISGYIGKKTYPCDDNIYASNCIQRTYNSYGFRGDEFEKEKPDDVFRIFAIGGSTTAGSTADDDKTWPGHLQQIIDEKTSGEKIEIIN